MAVGVMGSLPVGPRRFATLAEAVGSCPITVRVHTGNAIGAAIASDSAPLFNLYNPGTTLSVTPAGSDENATYDLAHHTAEIAITSRPLTASERLDKYEWWLADHVWLSTNSRFAAPRGDNSAQVKADDWINYMRNPVGVAIVASYAQNAIPAAPVSPLPDADVDLAGNVSLRDLLMTSQRWGASSNCAGWIRNDVENGGNVSLGDIGAVQQKWGLDGLKCGASTNCCPSGGVCDWTAVFKERMGLYAHAEGCNDGVGSGDPITVVVRQRFSADDSLGADGFARVVPQVPPPPIIVYGLLDVHDDWLEWVSGLWVNPGTWFKADGACAYSEILRDDTEGHEFCVRNLLPAECLKSRFHARGHTQALEDPQYLGLYDTPLTPHFDTAIEPCDPCDPGPGHCDDEDPPWVYRKHVNAATSFQSARDRLGYEWIVASGGHIRVDYQFWGNTDRRVQCDGTIARSDGWVTMLAVCGEVPGFPCS